MIDRSRLGRPALGFGYYEGEILDPRWRQALAEWARARGLFAEHLLLADLGGSLTRRILARQRVGEHLFSIEVRKAELPDAALQQPTPVADLNIHRDTFRDERLCLLVWVPRERARRFLELASNLVDYRSVDLDVPPFPEETPPVKPERRQPVPHAWHNLPMATLGRQFIGREEEIARVQAMLLAAGSGAITDALALEGLGGIGKTRLAVEYAWEHLADYDWVFFLRADTPETLRAGLARLADHEWLD
ncbi:MAG: ATP-binding protein, partial [Beggiatoa sp.]|nr:ATP-binding protein [Beggiatoa sp.]